MLSSNSNSQGILVKLLNAAALLMVLGCILFLSSTNERQPVSAEDRLSQFGLVEEDVTIPTTKNTKKRVLSKGKGSYYDEYYYYYTDCVPLYPTPAPTKGKGKGYYRQLDTDSNNKERKLSKGSKGSYYSAAPSFYCSDAPSLSPTTSAIPTTTIAPSGAPSVSSAPSCYGKGKGKGSSLFDASCGNGKSGKGKGSHW